MKKVVESVKMTVEESKVVLHNLYDFDTLRGLSLGILVCPFKWMAGRYGGASLLCPFSLAI